MTAPYILALDIATKTGVCEGRAGETPRMYSVQFGKPGDEHEDAFERALRWVAERLQVSRPDAIFVEAPINPGAFVGRYDEERGKVTMTTNPDTTIRLMGLWAVLAAAVRLKGIRYERVNVQTARKLFIGVGNLKGQEAKRRCYDLCTLLGWDPSNRDESDSACVWNWGVTKIAPRLAPVITPMMHAKVATTVAGVDTAAPLFRRRA
jgi:hypothetical protein